MACVVCPSFRKDASPSVESESWCMHEFFWFCLCSRPCYLTTRDGVAPPPAVRFAARALARLLLPCFKGWRGFGAGLVGVCFSLTVGDIGWDSAKSGRQTPKTNLGDGPRTPPRSLGLLEAVPMRGRRHAAGARAAPASQLATGVRSVAAVGTKSKLKAQGESIRNTCSHSHSSATRRRGSCCADHARGASVGSPIRRRSCWSGMSALTPPRSMWRGTRRNRLPHAPLICDDSGAKQARAVPQ